MHSMQMHDKTHEQTEHTVTGKRMWDDGPLHYSVIEHAIEPRARHDDDVNR
jgi:hypothetical protein